jgi:hypothetical protein
MIGVASSGYSVLLRFHSVGLPELCPAVGTDDLLSEIPLHPMCGSSRVSGGGSPQTRQSEEKLELAVVVVVEAKKRSDAREKRTVKAAGNSLVAAPELGPSSRVSARMSHAASRNFALPHGAYTLRAHRVCLGAMGR